MTISDIYNQYRIMPALQLHMLRVASVADTICEHVREPVPDQHEITAACLLHDMGNIIKADLNYFPEFRQPEGLKYWEGVKKEFIEKYGPDEHRATMEIANELTVSERVRELTDSFGFSKAEERYNDPDVSKKICVYADYRVAPYGVRSLDERMEEGHERYSKKQDVFHDEWIYQNLLSYIKKIEQQILERINLTPDQITEASVQPRIERFRSFEL